MPSAKFLNSAAIEPLIRSGKLSQATIDDKARRILRTAVRMGWLDRPSLDATIPNYNAAGREVALQTAREAVVLLKNDNNMLPLENKIRAVGLIGPNAHPGAPHAFGSATAAAFREISLLEGLTEALGTDVAVHYARGMPGLSACRTHYKLRHGR